MAEGARLPDGTPLDDRRKADLAFHFRRHAAGKPPCMANRRGRHRERWWRWLFVAIYGLMWWLAYPLMLSPYVTAMKWRWLRGEIRERRIAAMAARALMARMAAPLARQTYASALADNLVNVRPMTDDEIKGLQ